MVEYRYDLGEVGGCAGDYSRVRGGCHYIAGAGGDGEREDCWSGGWLGMNIHFLSRMVVGLLMSHV